MESTIARGQSSRIGIWQAHFVCAGRQDSQKNLLKLHLNKTWGLGTINAHFIAHMERLLWLYALPYDPLYPVVCFDERPGFLIGDVRAPLPRQRGHVRKEHYAYEKNGVWSLLAAIEPLTGKRVAQVDAQRTKKEYTQFCQASAAAWPTAIKIRLVQDNLNTHTSSAFYEHLPAADAFALAERFEVYYTPKSASWLNMIEIEFSALVRDCLPRRIPTREQLTQEVLALVSDRQQKQIKIHWPFSLEAARHKLNRHYESGFAANAQYKGT